MEITFNELKSKEIINIFDGKRLGRASDVCFEKETSQVTGIIIPVAHRLFQKSEDMFIPISKIKKIGDDVLLVKLSPKLGTVDYQTSNKNTNYNNQDNRTVYAKYRRVVQKEK